MTEEVNNQENSDKKPVETNYEEIARGEGWRSKDELGEAFDPARYVGAEEFVKRKPLFDTIKELKKELKDQKKTVDSVVTYSKQATDLAVKRAIKDLQEQKTEAIKLGDVTQVENIDKTIKEHEKIIETNTSSVAPEIIEFTKNNEWIDKDDELQEFAVAWHMAYRKKNPDSSLNYSLEKMKDATKRAFPDNKYFKSETETRREKLPVVEGDNVNRSTEKGKKVKSYDVKDLPEEYQRSYKEFVKNSKMMTHDAYFESLKEIGVVE
jgi:hypothetical protein